MEKKLTNFYITSLHKCPEAVSLLAGWHLHEHKKYSASATLDSCEKKLRDHLTTASIPATFVAYIADEIIGSVSLVLYKRLAGPEPTPWVSNVFVREDWRRRGVGSAMLNFIQVYAKQQRVAKLYLWTTEHTPFYLQQGWKKQRPTYWRGQSVDVMTLVL